MNSWTFVELIYLINVLIFGYLFYYFLKALKSSGKKEKIVMKTMTILTGVLFLQELYFGINTLTDPNKLAVLPQTFPYINNVWILAKIILTVAGITIVYTLRKLKK